MSSGGNDTDIVQSFEAFEDFRSNCGLGTWSILRCVSSVYPHEPFNLLSTYHVDVLYLF